MSKLVFLFSRRYSIKKVSDSIAALLSRITTQARAQGGPGKDRRLRDENIKGGKPWGIVSNRRQTRRIGIEGELENVRISRILVKRDRPEMRKPEKGRFMKEERVGIENNGNIQLNVAGLSDVDII